KETMRILKRRRTVLPFVAFLLAPLAGAAGQVSNDVGDLNGNGLFDVVITNQNDHEVAVYFGVDENTFTQPTIYLVDSPSCVAVADLNGDGFPDVAVGSAVPADPEVVIFINDGTGALTEHSRVSIPIVPSLMAASDFCGGGVGDGFPELYLQDEPDNGEPTYVEISDMQVGMTARIIGDGSQPSSCGPPASFGSTAPCND